MIAAFDPVAETARYIDSLGPAALARAKAYTDGSNLLELLGVIVALLVATVIVRSRLLDRIAARMSGRSWALASFVTAAAFMALNGLISLPWTVFTDWWRERHFGLSQQPLGDFLGQLALSEAISVVLGGLFLLGIYALIRKTGQRWWLWAGGFTALVTAVMLLAAPSLLMPLFNKFEPVPPGPVRTALEQIADQVKIPHDRIFMYDGSRQSDRFTANVAGIGPTARIAIADVAMKKASLAEVRAVTGHEAGHYKLGHVWRGVLVMPLLAMAMFWLLNRLFAPMAQLLGSDAQLGEPRGLPVFVVLLSIFGLLASPITNGLSRIDETEADAYSLRTVNEPDALASALVKTAEYRYPRPSDIQELIFYDHPSVEKRVRMAMEWKAAHPAGPPPAQ